MRTFVLYKTPDLRLTLIVLRMNAELRLAAGTSRLPQMRAPSMWMAGFTGAVGGFCLAYQVPQFRFSPLAWPAHSTRFLLTQLVLTAGVGLPPHGPLGQRRRGQESTNVGRTKYLFLCLCHYSIWCHVIEVPHSSHHQSAVGTRRFGGQARSALIAFITARQTCWHTRPGSSLHA